MFMMDKMSWNCSEILWKLCSEIYFSPLGPLSSWHVPLIGLQLFGATKIDHWNNVKIFLNFVDVVLWKYRKSSRILLCGICGHPGPILFPKLHKKTGICIQKFKHFPGIYRGPQGRRGRHPRSCIFLSSQHGLRLWVWALRIPGSAVSNHPHGHIGHSTFENVPPPPPA